MTSSEDASITSNALQSTISVGQQPFPTVMAPTPSSPRSSHNSSTSTTDTEEPKEPHTPGRLNRPRLIKRVSSGTMIIPRDQPTMGPEREYPPDDVRSMSPRRSSEITHSMFDHCRESREALLKCVHPKRITLQEPVQVLPIAKSVTNTIFDIREALDMQDTLAMLAEKVNEAQTGCETLEKNNQALQDAIGDMTRNLAKESFSKKKK
ncbi:MAG: hypothetical protein Q9190_006459 [Brigantiaea leucoxantha]